MEPQEVVLFCNDNPVVVSHTELPRIVHAVCPVLMMHSFLRTLKLGVICRLVWLLSCLVSPPLLLRGSKSTYNVTERTWLWDMCIVRKSFHTSHEWTSVRCPASEDMTSFVLARQQM